MAKKSKTTKIKIVKSENSDEDEILDKWYVRAIALTITPLYAILKIYDLLRFVRNTVLWVLGGIIDFLVFFVCFGWFWDTFILKKFKKLACIRYTIKRKWYYHVLNLLSGFLQVYLLRSIIPVPPHYLNHITIICGSLNLIMVLISLKMRKIHCLCILLLPTLLSRHGRRFLLVLLVASLIDGPIMNMQKNTGLLTAEMNCISGTAKNTSGVLVDNVKDRYLKLHNHVLKMKNKTEERMKKISDKLDEVREKVASKHAFLLRVVRKVNEFVDKCSSTMDNLNDKCHATFGTSKCKRAAGIEEDAYNYTNLDSLRWEDYILPVQGKEMTIVVENEREGSIFKNSSNYKSHVTVVEPDSLAPILANISHCPGNCTPPNHADANNQIVHYNKIHYQRHPANDSVHTGKIFHVRKKRWNIFGCFWHIIKAIFKGILKPLCTIIFHSIRLLCTLPKLLTQFISGIVLQKFRYLEQSIKKNTWMEVTSDVVFEKEVIEVRSKETAVREFEEKISERLDQYQAPTLSFTIVGWLKFLTLLLVYWNAYSYMKKYSSDTSFDNIYIDRSLKKIDSKAEETIFPLSFKDQKKYIVMSQKQMTSDESYIATRSSLKAACYLAFTAAVELGNLTIQLLLRLMYDYGPVRFEHSINMTDINDIEAIASNKSTIDLVFDSRSCFIEPYEVELSSIGYHFLLASAILCLSVTQVYFFRIRHTVCDSFHRANRQRRAEFLHTKILTSRNYASKHAAETLFAHVSEKNKLCKFFPWLYKPTCSMCSRKEFLQKCNTCDIVYCVVCLEVLKSHCKICTNLVFQQKSAKDVSLKS